MSIRRVPLALVLVLVCTGGVLAQPLSPTPGVLPPATRFVQPTLPPSSGVKLFVMPSVGQMIPPSPLPPPGYRPSAYRVWQYYGLTYQGWLRPRVIQGNGGARGYYLYNGYPFPTNVYPGHHWMPMGKE